MPERKRALGWLTFAIVSFIALVFLVTAFCNKVRARDLDGRYAQSPLKPWFDSLRSGKGACCSDADGSAVSDADWETDNGHYRVRIEDEWYPVPDDAVLTQPNLYSKTVVWPNTTRGLDGKISKMDIRCFMPGSMT